MSMTITPERLAEIVNLAEEATPGPWTVRTLRPHTLGPAWVDAPNLRGVADCGQAAAYIKHLGFCGRVEEDTTEANAAHIARMDPSTTLALVAHVREVESELSHVMAGWKSAMERAKSERDELVAKLEEAKKALEAASRMLVCSFNRIHYLPRESDTELAYDIEITCGIVSVALSHLTAEPASKGDEG